MERPKTGLFIGIIAENDPQSVKNGIHKWYVYGGRIQNELDGLNKIYAEWQTKNGYLPTALDARIATCEDIIDKVNQEIAYLTWLLNELEPQQESDNFGL